MGKLASDFNFGSVDTMTMEELVIKLQRMYHDIAESVNAKSDVYQRTVDGQTTDTFLPQGSININTATNNVQILTNHVSSTAVVWTQLS